MNEDVELEKPEKVMKQMIDKYEKTIKTRDIVIKQLREDMIGQQQILQMLYAFIVLFIGEGEHRANRNDISQALGKFVVKTKISEDGNDLIINCTKRNDTDDRLRESEKKSCANKNS